MKIALTGGTGGVGTELALTARAQGHEVAALVRDEGRAPLLAAAGVKLVRGDLEDAESLGRLVAGAEVVIHTAALVGDSGTARDHERINVEGTRALLEAAGAARARKLVHLSSVAVYGMPEAGTINETFPFVFTDEPYALTKRAAEELVFRRGPELGLAVSAVRPPIIFGPYDRVFLPRAIEQLRAGRAVYVDGGRAPLNCVSSADVVDVLLRCANQAAADGEAFNVASWPPPSLRAVLDAIADGAGVPRPGVSVPKGMAMAIARALEATWKLAGITKPPPLTTFVVRRFTRYVVYDAAKARRVLGWGGGEHPTAEISRLAAQLAGASRGAEGATFAQQTPSKGRRDGTNFSSEGERAG